MKKVKKTEKPEEPEVFSIEETWLECINCGYKTNLLKETKFRCPECGMLYDVEHFFDPNVSFEEYTRIFDKRAELSNYYSTDPRVNSVVWRFQEWIMPYLPEEFIVSLNEQIRISRAGKNLEDWIGGGVKVFIIDEGVSQTGSFKDNGGTVLMSVAKAARKKALGCASTGDTSAMASAYGAKAKIACTVCLPERHITPIQGVQPKIYGAKTILIPGKFDDCMAIMGGLVSHHGVYPANSLNPARIEGHQATVFYLAQYRRWQSLPEWIAVPVGNGSDCASIGKGMRLMKRRGFKGKTSRILGCQSHAAKPLTESWKRAIDEVEVILCEEDWEQYYRPTGTGETIATAACIGDPVSYKKVIREIVASNGAMEEASEAELSEAIRVAGSDGIAICPQTATAVAAVRNAVRAGLIKPGEEVAIVQTANALKFAEAIATSLPSNVVHAKTCKLEEVAQIMGV